MTIALQRAAAAMRAASIAEGSGDEQEARRHSRIALQALKDAEQAGAHLPPALRARMIADRAAYALRIGEHAEAAGDMAAAVELQPEDPAFLSRAADVLQQGHGPGTQDPRRGSDVLAPPGS